MLGLFTLLNLCSAVVVTDYDITYLTVTVYGDESNNNAESSATAVESFSTPAQAEALSHVHVNTIETSAENIYSTSDIFTTTTTSIAPEVTTSTIETPSTTTSTTTSTTSTTSTSSTPEVTTTSTTTSTTAVVTTSSEAVASATQSGLSSFEQDIADFHNKVRAEHQAGPVVWNSTIAQFASDYLASDSCVFKHSGGPYGENIAMGYSTPDDAMEAWYDEYKDYDYAAGQFGETTGHFTQMVWVSTTSVGCALDACNGRPFLVCEYYPRGNVIGWFTENVLE